MNPRREARQNPHGAAYFPHGHPRLTPPGVRIAEAMLSEVQQKNQERARGQPQGIKQGDIGVFSGKKDEEKPLFIQKEKFAWDKESSRSQSTRCPHEQASIPITNWWTESPTTT